MRRGAIFMLHYPARAGCDHGVCTAYGAHPVRAQQGTNCQRMRTIQRHSTRNFEQGPTGSSGMSHVAAPETSALLLWLPFAKVQAVQHPSSRCSAGYNS